MTGLLTLIPTPIDDLGMLDRDTFEFLFLQATKLRQKSQFLIEDLKPGRRRWLRWGLPRECIKDFYLYNEHSSEQEIDKFISLLQGGKNLFLMSDGGMPAFCDPGRRLIARCHDLNIKVTSRPLYNSVILALALSGFDHRSFRFEGFLPRKQPERKLFLIDIISHPTTVVLMDTPYRLLKLLAELVEVEKEHARGGRQIFLATDLTSREQNYWRGDAKRIISQLSSKERREFVLIIEAIEPL